MTYKEFIDNILKTRGRFACGEEYHERHHIVPKCMGGTNDKDNLIDLFAREHFEAHRILALEYPNEASLQFAWWNMCQRKGNNELRYIPTAEEYEEARKSHSENMSKLFSGRIISDEAKHKMRENHADFKGEKHPNYGKPMSEEQKQKLRNAHLGKPLSEEHKRSISKSQKGKKISEETKVKLKKANTGKKRTIETKNKLSAIAKERFATPENNPFYGKKHTEESRKKISANHADVSGKNNPNYGKRRTGEDASFYGHRHTNATKKVLSDKAKERLSDPKNNPNSKIVCQYDSNMKLVNIWWYKNGAANALGINDSAISLCCLGVRKTTGGYHWKYLYDQTRKDGTIIPGAISLGLITQEEAYKQLNDTKLSEE